MKPSDKQLAAGTLAFNSHKSVVIPDCISAAYDAMTDAMTVDDVPDGVRRKVESEIISKVFVELAPGSKIKFPEGLRVRFIEHL